MIPVTAIKIIHTTANPNKDDVPKEEDDSKEEDDPNEEDVPKEEDDSNEEVPKEKNNSILKKCKYNKKPKNKVIFNLTNNKVYRVKW